MSIERSFSVGPRVRIEAATTSGEIVVTEGPPGRVDLAVDGRTDNFTVEQMGDLIVAKPERSSWVQIFSVDITLVVPPDANLALSCTSGDVVVDTHVEEIEAGTASGDVRIASVGRIANIRTASGDIRVGSVGEHLSVTTASGTVRIGDAMRDAIITTASGDVYVDSIGERAEMKTASGDVDVRRLIGGELFVRTLSGDLRVGIPPSRLLDFDLQTMSGELRNRLEKRDDGAEPERTVRLQLKTVSGDVTLQNAR